MKTRIWELSDTDIKRMSVNDRAPNYNERHPKCIKCQSLLHGLGRGDCTIIKKYKCKQCGHNGTLPAVYPEPM